MVIQLVLLIALAAAGTRLGDIWGGAAATATTVLGVVLITAGGILFTWGLIALGRNLTPNPRPLESATLVEGGAYALVRHPLYGGLTVAAFGWGLLQASPVALLLAVGLFGFFDLKSRREETWLVKKYAGYVEYASRVRRLIPWIY
ncbi:MAG: isoprenylcysteine carboxylmethyltransferase family protein [Chloroflexota bacterium]